MTKGNGLPCLRCGTSEWYKDGHCVECRRAAGRRYRRNNPEKAREAVRRWEQANPEKKRGHVTKWHKENPEKKAKSIRQWQKNNPEKVASIKHRRRTRKTEAGGSYTAAEWKALCKQYNNRCLCCGKKKKLTADHVIPVSKGGTSNISNIQPLCGPCNSRKGDKTTDYRTKPGIRRWIQKRLFG